MWLLSSIQMSFLGKCRLRHSHHVLLTILVLLITLHKSRPRIQHIRSRHFKGHPILSVANCESLRWVDVLHRKIKNIGVAVLSWVHVRWGLSLIHVDECSTLLAIHELILPQRWLDVYILPSFISSPHVNLRWVLYVLEIVLSDTFILKQSRGIVVKDVILLGVLLLQLPCCLLSLMFLALHELTICNFRMLVFESEGIVHDRQTLLCQPHRWVIFFEKRSLWSQERLILIILILFCRKPFAHFLFSGMWILLPKLKPRNDPKILHLIFSQLWFFSYHVNFPLRFLFIAIIWIIHFF